MNFRYIIYFLSTWTISLVFALRLSFHSTILCQYNINDTEHYLADPNLRGWSFSSVSIGLVLGLIPLSFLNSLGTRKVISIYVLAGCFSSLLYPWSDRQGFVPSFIIRMIQGMPGAIILWAVNNVSMEWAPKNEVGFAIAILSSIYQISPIIAMVTAGEMCSNFHWEYTYYFLSGVTILFLGIFYYLYNDNYKKNRFISEDEKIVIGKGKSEVQKISNTSDIPFFKLFTDIQVWIAWYMYFSFFSGMYIFLQYGPTYINMVLKYDIRSTGYAGALPHLISLILKFFYGKMLDNFLGLCQRTRMMLLFAIVEIISAGCLLVLIFTDIAIIGLIVYIVFNSINGLAVVVIMKQIQLISRQHAHFLANGNTFIVSICIFCAPIIVNLVVPDNSASQWAILYAGIACQLLSAILLYCLFGKTTPSKWTELSIVLQDIK